MNKLVMLILFFTLHSNVFAQAVCMSSFMPIEKLYVRSGGWVLVQIEGLTNIDLKNCGSQSNIGVILNYNDTTGSVEGKQMVYSALLTAFSAGKRVQICSDGCDSQHPSFSRLSYVDVEK